MTGDHDRLPSGGIRSRKCLCSRYSIDPQPRRVGDVTFRGPVDEWNITAHCSFDGKPSCIWRHMTWQYADNGAVWQRCGGIHTQREADEFKLMHPNGLSDDEIRKANGA